MIKQKEFTDDLPPLPNENTAKFYDTYETAAEKFEQWQIDNPKAHIVNMYTRLASFRREVIVIFYRE